MRAKAETHRVPESDLPQHGASNHGSEVGIFRSHRQQLPAPRAESPVVIPAGTEVLLSDEVVDLHGQGWSRTKQGLVNEKTLVEGKEAKEGKNQLREGRKERSKLSSRRKRFRSSCQSSPSIADICILSLLLIHPLSPRLPPRSILLLQSSLAPPLPAAGCVRPLSSTSGFRAARMKSAVEGRCTSFEDSRTYRELEEVLTLKMGRRWRSREGVEERRKRGLAWRRRRRTREGGEREFGVDLSE